MTAYAYATSWGAQMLGTGGVRFRLWAPSAKSVALLVDGDERKVAMPTIGGGWFECIDARARAGTRYRFLIDGQTVVPDPAARFQPEGPHGPSEVIDPQHFAWAAAQLPPRSLRELIFYELHVGAFTPDGTYAAAAERLADLVDLGVTAIELMPLAETPGGCNWGYDGVELYAPAHRYGRPEDLKRFIAAAHDLGLCVFLDVVYNHFGPEGNYLHRYAAPFFTDRYATPWGAAIDYSADTNDPVRRYVIENACYWLCEYRFDGLRFDATEMIFDERPVSVLHELAAEAHRAAGRTVYLIVENDRNDVNYLRAGYDGQWNDDVHHCLHVVLTGERDGYYQDFADAPVALLGRALTQGYAYQGEPSPFRDGHPRGASSGGVPLIRFVNCLQNHDQTGNRALGERITMLAPPQAVRAAVAVLLLAPSLPLLFMGEEWAASSPFLFFCDFEPELAKLVTQGRRREFARFAKFADPANRATIPDPSERETFFRSRLDWRERDESKHRAWLTYYRALLRLRHEEIIPRIASVSSENAAYDLHGERGLHVSWCLTDTTLSLDANLGDDGQPGFEESPVGDVLFATHDARFPDGIAPPWSVRWTLR